MLSESVQWYILVGGLLVSVAAFRSTLSKTWLAPVHLQLIVGIIAGPLCLGLIHLDLVSDAKPLEVASEIAVIISLYAAGVKMRVPLNSGRWKAPLLLATLTMAVTIGLTAVAATWLFGISLAAALLMGAVLAPTDPVLADKIQVEHPHDDDRLRQSLTGEAGLNDGTAFPFVLLAVGLSDPGLHSLGTGLTTWILIDLFWKILGGILFGAAAGYALGRGILWVRSTDEEHHAAEELLTMGLIAIVYGTALAINTYAFLAVFSAAVSLRRIELLGSKTATTGDPVTRPIAHNKLNAQESSNETEGEQGDVKLLRDQTAVASALERIAQVFLVVIVGVLLTSNLLLNGWLWLFAAILIFVIRPLSVFLTLHVRSINSMQRNLIAWFGIRGIGTIYYLSHAISLGVNQPLGDELSLVIGCCIVTITLSILIHGTSDTPLMRQYALRNRR